ncbi:MAG: MBL fold metallo-hydrolase [Myxococcaceae bacterium]
MRRLRWIAGGVLLLIAGLMTAISLLDRPLESGPSTDPGMGTELPPAQPPAALRFSVLVTSHSAGAPEPLVVAGGSWARYRRPVHAAVLVEHPRGTFLFDTGLGRDAEAQFAANAFLDALVFRFDPVDPVVEQLRRHGYPPQRVQWIVLSHLHWDHASGLPDFPGVPVWVPESERAAAASGEPPAFLSSQYRGVKDWRTVRFEHGPILGFPRSQDVFGDGSVVLVPLAGHTPGHTGMLLTLADGSRYLFTGDVTWTAEGVRLPADRSWLLRRMVHLDGSTEENQAQILKLHRLHQAHPGLVIVPAHDEHVVSTLPHFPPTRR